MRSLHKNGRADFCFTHWGEIVGDPDGVTYRSVLSSWCVLRRRGYKLLCFRLAGDRGPSLCFRHQRQGATVDAPWTNGWLFSWLPSRDTPRNPIRFSGGRAICAGIRAFFNADKLLTDPYARALQGQLRWRPAVLGYNEASRDNRDTRNSATFVPKSIVVDPFFDWEGDRKPGIPMRDTVIYETHVKGISATHPEVPQAQRGTYAGLAHPAIIDHLRGLGVTTVDLLPVQHFVSERHLDKKRLSNYWGYNTLGFFAPHKGYAASRAAGGQVQEFKSMVKSLHAAGMEVILDIVFNHTAEGDPHGPTLCFRGLDDLTYYRRAPGQVENYQDFTGCGNTLNFRHPQAVRFVTDCLRYWVNEMHVDGFRFDLAVAMTRDHLGEVDWWSPVLSAISQDPDLRHCKLIAEPWDVGINGYQVGAFPFPWSEWNGQYRDVVRDLWRGQGGVGAFASRFAGSADIYGPGGRGPRASINFVTCHDGFPMRDLVSYNHKHNLANGEDNRDGESHNRSWNCGVEGETDKPEIISLRRRQVRNILTTLFLSQGTPMLLGGDEIGRTQGGNNNAYCQDNAVSWYDWKNTDSDLLDFVRRLVAYRMENPAFRRGTFFTHDIHEKRAHPDAAREAARGLTEDVTAGDLQSENIPEIGWFRPDGHPMQAEDWPVPYARALAVVLRGQGERIGPEEDAVPPLCGPARCDHLIVFNAGDEAITFQLPPNPLERSAYKPWRLRMDTAEDRPWEPSRRVSRRRLEVGPRSVCLLESPVVLGAMPETGSAGAPDGPRSSEVE